MTKKKPRLREEEPQENTGIAPGITLETLEMKDIREPKLVKEVAVVCPPECSEGPGPVCGDKDKDGNGNGTNGNGTGANGNGANGKVGNGNGGNGNGGGDSGAILSTIPPDPRWPNANVTNYCYMMFVDYHRCVTKRGADYEPCEYFKKAYKGLCPNEWVERWQNQMEIGTFPRKFNGK